MNEKMCYRCGICSMFWPLASQYSKCPLCEETCTALQVEDIVVLTHDEAKKLVKLETAEPPHQNSGLGGGMIGGSEGKVPEHRSIHSAAVFEHRYGAFMRMGFGPSEAEALANTHEDTHRIKRMLASGCLPEVAISILL